MKAGLLIGMAVLAGCATKPTPSPVPAQAPAPAPGLLSPEVVALMNNPRPAPYIKGKTTEDELFAARGQPNSRSIAADGTRTDTYKNTFIHLDGSSGTLKIVEKLPPGSPPDPDMKTYYIFSPDGILKQILRDRLVKGPNGEELADVTDGQPSITITGRHQVSGSLPPADTSP